jgi:uncharacterized protein
MASASAVMKSRVYECRVMHARLAPVHHRFNYRMFMLALDLDELPDLDRRLRLFSLGRRNLYTLDLRDYLPITEPCHPAGTTPLPNPAATLKARVLHLLTAQGFDPGPAPRVELVTLPRVFGYAFNPVSFYFCSRADGTPVAAIAEVTNTFREMKPYVLPPIEDTAAREPALFAQRVDKGFYVSPFSEADLAFDFKLRSPAERLAVQIDTYRGGVRTLTSTLHGRMQPLTDAALARFTVLYPLLTVRVIAGIHWQALRLYLKRVPWFRKTDRAAAQRDLFRPHASLSAVPPR